MNEEELLRVPVPSKTDSYSPVPYRDVIDHIEEELDKRNLGIQNRSYRTNKKGTQVVGYFDVAANHMDFNFRMAFRNSYDKTMSLAFVAGISVMICENGMIVGDTKFVRKHTGTVLQEMKSKISNTVSDYDSVLSTADQDSKKMKNVHLDKTATAELCGRFFMEQDIITSSQLNIIKDELKSPSYEEFEEENLWSLYNHTTHALKKTHPLNYLDKYKQLHEFVTKEVMI